MPSGFLCLRYLGVNIVEAIRSCVTVVERGDSGVAGSFKVGALHVFNSMSQGRRARRDSLSVYMRARAPGPFLLTSLGRFLRNLFGYSISMIHVRGGVGPFFGSEVRQSKVCTVQWVYDVKCAW